MTTRRTVHVAAAQLGPVDPGESRAATVDRLVELLREAAGRGAGLVVYPEAALTPFFPHWWIEDEAELDGYFETSMPNPTTRPLFDEARRLRVGVCLGFCELDQGRRYNSSVLVDRDGRVVGVHRKVHLPGYVEPRPGDPFQNLEKRYFEPGDRGFGVWAAFGTRVGMAICNDRRWPETFRMLGLQGAELALVGYNTPIHNPAQPHTDRLAEFQNRLCLQAGAYHNGLWVVGVAKAGREAGVDQIGGSCIVAPTGEVVAAATTTGDEVVTAVCDLELSTAYQKGVFDFAVNRRPEHYRLITEPTG
jgi:N-carbamoyl-D-amino-acid hydrolase